MANNVDKVIAIAQAEVGYLEKSYSAYRANPAVLDKKTEGAGSDNYTKYGRDMHRVYPAVMDFPAAWCDCFVDWCFWEAYGVANAKSLLGGNFDDYTVASVQLYKSKGAYYRSNPQVGDQIFFKNSSGGVCHTGLIYKVTSTTIYTIEGNTSSAAGVVANGGCVAYKQYPIGYSRIDGFGRPNYDKNGSGAGAKSIDVIAKEVINGYWGTGDDRKNALTRAGYDAAAVQKKVNEIMSKPTATKPVLKSNDEIAKEVIAGKWGTGTDRISALTKAGYNATAIQKRVNELVKSTASAKKSVDTVAREVIAGNWGTGNDRINALTKAGYDPKAVQKKVNELLGASNRKSVDTVAREVIAGKWGNNPQRAQKLKAAGYDPNEVQRRVNQIV